MTDLAPLVRFATPRGYEKPGTVLSPGVLVLDGVSLNEEALCKARKSFQSDSEARAESSLRERREAEAWEGLLSLLHSDIQPAVPRVVALQEARSMLTRAYRLAAVYGLSLESYFRLLVKQNGVCAICGCPPDEGRWFSVDHDHSCCPSARSCGKCVRALLCTSCNWTLGRVELTPGGGAVFDAYIARFKSLPG